MRRLLHGDDWWARPSLWVELFLVNNLAFLAVDIALAHAANAFEHPAEWIPIGFSVAATILLLVAMGLGGIDPGATGGKGPSRQQWRDRTARAIGLSVGWGSVLVGVAGLLWHLDGDFFQRQTLKNLVYTAPFVAPLAYAGLGLLLILDRMVEVKSAEWARWVILLAAGGFAGNYVLSLADHAQNGFYYPSEWIGVVAGAVATGFLIAGIVAYDNPGLLVVNLLLMIVQAAVGMLGFLLHVQGNLAHPAASPWDTLIFGPPIFAPLLFADLGLLAMLGLWALARWQVSATRVPSLAAVPVS